MYFGSANRDSQRFEQPDTLDLSRTPNVHIAFGTGPHGCLGQHIARIEIDALLHEVLVRAWKTSSLPMRQNGCPSNFISGPKTMKVRFRKRGNSLPRDRGLPAAAFSGAAARLRAGSPRSQGGNHCPS